MIVRQTSSVVRGEKDIPLLWNVLFSVVAFTGLFSTVIVGGRQPGALYLYQPDLSLVLPFVTVGLATLGSAAVGLPAFRRYSAIIILAYSFVILTGTGMIVTRAAPANVAVAVVSSLVPVVCIGFISHLPARLVLPWLKVYMRWLALLLGAQTLIAARGSLTESGLLNKDVLVISVGGSNYAAAFLTMATLFLLFRPWQPNWLDYASIAVGVTALVASGSTGGNAAFLIAATIGALLYGRSRIWAHLAAIGCLIAMAVWGLYVSSTPIIRSVTNFFFVKRDFLSAGDTTGLLARRDELWETSWLVFSANPWFGSSQTISIRADDQAFRAHSWLLELLATRGLLTATVFTLLLAVVGVRLFRAARTNPVMRSASVALLGVVIHGLVEPNFFAIKFDWVFWFMIAGAFACDPRFGVLPPRPATPAPPARQPGSWNQPGRIIQPGLWKGHRTSNSDGPVSTDSWQEGAEMRVGVVALGYMDIANMAGQAQEYQGVALDLSALLVDDINTEHSRPRPPRDR